MREDLYGSGQSRKIGQYAPGLIISEMALAIVLMVGAGLLLRTFWGLLRENPGFNSSNVVGVSLRLPVPNDPKADPYLTVGAQSNFVREALQRISGYLGWKWPEPPHPFPWVEPAGRCFPRDRESTG